MGFYLRFIKLEPFSILEKFQTIQKTLEDWARFDISRRTSHDASISSGLAIMACRKHMYRPNMERTNKKIDFRFAKYKNDGSMSKIIQ